MDSNGAMENGQISMKFKSTVEDDDKTPKQHGSEVIPGSKQGGVVNVIVSGLALFSDGYNAQIIGYMEPLFSVLYKDGMSSMIKTRLSNSYLIGEIFGMLFFGVLIDRRGFLVAITTDFAVDLDFVAAGIVSLIVLACFQQEVKGGVWRVSFIIGIVLPILIFFLRIRMVNSTQYRKHAIKSKYPYMLVLKRYWKPMLGTSLAWFCYDFISYPFGIFSSTIISQLGPDNTTVQNIGFGTVVNCFYLPGCIVGGLLMDRIGRKQNMTLGFMLCAVWGFILGGALRPIQSVFPLFVVMYGIFNAFQEMGPGVSTFLCASESFPTPLRGHFMGLAAAVGKAGAAIGTEVFTPIQNSFDSTFKGQQAVFLIGSGFAVLGGLCSWFLIPDMSRELETEDARFKAYLEENGYDISHYGEALLVERRN
ncbi:probable metabolite transport protein GIT1 [Aspergillus udagawae]|uniref:Probable metabolite transport protein GIT1 n=1 Tax=Aspergillus udagawae TaxID=91492 RepID=A0A8H3RZE0_9EURO|nr:probable metabolite transport protein GIT1 [Aspergillus udagawae]